MSQFKYTLPSGKKFVVNGPSGATQAQADKIFYEQIASGSLVGYTPGQTLTNPATEITKFELSRLDRGTAGVDTPAVLAVIQGLPTISGIPDLTKIPIQNPIDQADIILAKGDNLDPTAVGPLSSFDVQKLLAQITNIVDQPYDEISQDKGIGKYGLTAYQLEQAGYVKPGTTATYISETPEDFVAVMNSPSVWTGQDGITSLDQILADESRQTVIQNQIMQQSYTQLTQTGVITDVASPAGNKVQGTVFTNGGLATVSALTLLGGNLGSLTGLVNNALSGNTDLSKLLSSSVTNLTSLASGAVNSLTTGLNNLADINFSNIGAGITNQITGGIGALVANASKFGSQATALWANSGGLPNLSNIAGINLNSLTSSLGNVNLNSIASNLTNLVPGSLSNLTSGLNLLGKASQYSVNFANPLGSLNNFGSLANLGDLTKLPNLGSASSLINSASASVASLAGNFSNLTDLNSLGDVFSGGGGDLVSGTQVAAGFNNTVDRKTVDAAFKRILGSNKIPVPDFDYPSDTVQAEKLDLAQAETFLQSLGSSSTSSEYYSDV